MHNRFLIALLVVSTLLTPAKPQSSEPYRISTNVDLVVLHPVVRDRKGEFVSNLHKQDFAVYEDGVRQSIRLFDDEDVPVTIGLVIDHSGSMRNKLPNVAAAARSFIKSSSPQDEMFVVNFNDNVILGLPGAMRFSNRPDELVRAISNTPTAGETTLYDAVYDALKYVQTGAQERKVLIVMTDGGDNASVHRLSEVLNKAGTSNTLIYTLGIYDADDPDRNPNVLRRLAKTTGGEAYFPARLAEVVGTCERIARDIRHQYTIGYAPTAAMRPGAFRAVRVAAQSSGNGQLLVRARIGYIATK